MVLLPLEALADSRASVRMVPGMLGSCPLPCTGRSYARCKPMAPFWKRPSWVVALAFAVAVPSSPGFIGIFQLAGQQALVLPFGAKYDASTALAITITAHLTYYLLTTGLGIVGLWQLGESFGHLGRTLTRWSASALASRQKA